MIRELLADHFDLVMRVEQKTMPVYALTVASDGPTLQRSAVKGKVASSIAHRKVTTILLQALAIP